MEYTSDLIPVNQVQQHSFELAPSVETAEGAFAVNRQKSPSRYIIIL
jgi:site-specific DNA recombinase